MYLFLKWFHIISIISWMAGILYLYRLFIYHTERGVNNHEIHELLALMEYRLYKYITVPAMVASWIAGLAIIFVIPSYLSSGWLHAKLLFVLALSGSTGYAGKIRKKFAAQEQNLPSSKYLRWMNEVPTILMLIIVALVIFKPF